MTIRIYMGFLILILCFPACLPDAGKVEPVPGTRSQLGEGAVWNHRTGQLYWVDITGKLLNIYTPRLDITRELYTGQLIGTVVPAESGRVLVALEHGIYFLDPDTGTKQLILYPEGEPEGNRFNDGKCDPAGRFWVGTMSVNGIPGRGSLYRLDPDSLIRRMVDNVSISNGIAWSPDRSRMYYIDTPTQKVTGYEYDNITGEIRNGKTVIEIPDEMGHPDGMTIDNEGNLWICLWGGAAVGCWNPDTGKLLRKIDIPARNVTSCAFGDADLGTLYITTASIDTTPEELEKFPDAGALFKIRPGVTGVTACFFADKPVPVASQAISNNPKD